MNKYILAFLTFCLGCNNFVDNNSVKEIYPQLAHGLDSLVKDVGKEITTGELEVTGKLDKSTGEYTSKNLEVTITTAGLALYNQVMLDSLSKRISVIVKKHVRNLSRYDWLNIFYLTSDGTPVSDSINRPVYVVRPGEIDRPSEIKIN